MTISTKYLFLGVLAWGCAEPVRSEPIPEPIRVCRSQIDEQERLRCYDAAVDGAESGSPAPAPARDVTSADIGPGTLAGKPLEGHIAAHSSTAAPAEVAMFKAKVAAISFRPSGALNVTLDNGQVWAQFGPDRPVPVRVGDTVSLRPGLFNASLLVGPSGWVTKVHLIQTLPIKP